MSNEERTFIAIKPDGVQRRLVGEIIKRFEVKGFKLVGMKFLHVSYMATFTVNVILVQIQISVMQVLDSANGSFYNWKLRL